MFAIKKIKNPIRPIIIKPIAQILEVEENSLKSGFFVMAITLLQFSIFSLMFKETYLTKSTPSIFSISFLSILTGFSKIFS